LRKFLNIIKSSSFPLALLFGFSQAVAADIAIPFEAVYEIYIDGKPRMESRMVLSRDGDVWLYSNAGKGTKGLAKMLGAKSDERSVIRMENEQFQSIGYHRDNKIMGNSKRWSASFDRENLQVSTAHKDGESQFGVLPETTDPLSLTLAMRKKLLQGLDQFSISVIDETQIDEHKFSVGELEALETALGCFNSKKVTRVRENSSRYSSGWYAKEIEYFPVKILHGKKGGKEFEMKISQLTLNGNPVLDQQNCTP
jgi:hypothetical protein